MSLFSFQYRLERKSIALALAIVGVASIGGLVEIAPLFTIHQTVETDPDMRLYTPLELAGRNIYIREGCYACHSQMIRTLRDEVPVSVMPSYSWLMTTELRIDDLPLHLKAQRVVGVPYTDDMIANAALDAYGQSNPDSPQAEGVTKRYGKATTVRAFGGQPGVLTEMDALVAYLQILGRLTDAAHKSVAAAGAGQ